MQNGFAFSAAKYFNSSWFMSPGPLWFAFWLIVFNAAYALLDDTPYFGAVRRPNFFSWQWNLTMVLTGLGMGIGLWLVNQGGFIMMPFAVGSLINNIVFFVAGTFAKKNKWLNEPVSKSEGRFVYCFALLMIIVTITAQMTFLAAKPPPANTNTTNGTSNATTPYNPFTPDNIFHKLFWNGLILSGLLAFNLSGAVIVFFQQHFNWSNGWTKTFARSAFAVYIIHPFFVSLFTAVWYFIIKAMGGYVITYSPDAGTTWVNVLVYSPEDPKEWMIGLGWLVVNILTHLTVWPVAYLLTRIPILNSII
eukprot:g1982.t1